MRRGRASNIPWVITHGYHQASRRDVISHHLRPHLPRSTSHYAYNGRDDADLPLDYRQLGRDHVHLALNKIILATQAETRAVARVFLPLPSLIDLRSKKHTPYRSCFCLCPRLSGREARLFQFRRVFARMATNFSRISFIPLMAESPQTIKRDVSADWFVQGVLTKIGDLFDRLTGRGWKPGSSLATSEVIERLKKLLDAEVRTDAAGRGFVPHNIKLKMQWDKFSTDSETSLKALENEMLTAVVDHINDRHFYTYAPLSIEVKPDYFTEGVKLYVSFEKMTGEDAEREIDVSMPGTATAAAAETTAETLPSEKEVRISYSLNGETHERRITLRQGVRVAVGRTKENDVAIDDTSVSKYHAALVLNGESRVVVADTGSTNGTFVRGERIEYGKAVEVLSGEKVGFGTVEVMFEFAADPPPAAAEPATEAKTDVYKVGDFSFTKKTEVLTPQDMPALPKTEPAVHVATARENAAEPQPLPATQAAIDIEGTAGKDDQ